MADYIQGITFSSPLNNASSLMHNTYMPLQKDTKHAHTCLSLGRSGSSRNAPYIYKISECFLISFHQGKPLVADEAKETHG